MTILKSVPDKKSVSDKNDAPRLAAFLHDSSDEEPGEFREPHSAMDYRIRLGCKKKVETHACRSVFKLPLDAARQKVTTMIVDTITNYRSLAALCS